MPLPTPISPAPLATCNDGSKERDHHDCKDAFDYGDDDSDGSFEKLDKELDELRGDKPNDDEHNDDEAFQKLNEELNDLSQ